MTFEIILTDSCNRNCEFCFIDHTGYVESDDNIDKFISEVKDIVGDAKGRFSINIFGGEPFLNYKGIKRIYDAFENDYRYRINAVSNGDFIETWMASEIQRCHVSITTYDIFDEKSWEHYSTIYNAFKFCNCQYTVSGEDFNRIGELERIYRTLGFKYRIIFSHDLKSWSNVSAEELYDTVHGLAKREIGRYCDRLSNGNPRETEFLDQHFTRYCAGLFDSSMKDNFCTSNDKMSFYRGRFIGPCIRLCNVKMEFDGFPCRTCKYNKICSKSCFAEIKDNTVDSKLCTIERAQFDAIDEFMRSGNENVPRILQFYHDNPFPVS